MRITIKRGNIDVIPKMQISAAAKKLARYEDTGLDPEKLVEVDKLYTKKCAELGNAKAKLAVVKERVMKTLDELDGQLMDDPVSEIRERLEHVLSE